MNPPQFTLVSEPGSLQWTAKCHLCGHTETHEAAADAVAAVATHHAAEHQTGAV